MVRDPATTVVQLRGAQRLHHETEPFVEQLGAWICHRDIERRAAMSGGIQTLEQVAHETRAYALPAQRLSDADVPQIVFLRSRRADHRFGAQTANHDAPRVDRTIEFHYLKRALNREAQHRAAVERGASRGNPAAHFGDAMIPPAEFPSTMQVSKAEESLRIPRPADIEDVVESSRPRTVDERHRIGDIRGRRGTEGQCRRISAGHIRDQTGGSLIAWTGDGTG